MQAPITGGIAVPIISPLDAEERIDEPALRKAVNFLLAAGVHGVFAMGTTGECNTLAEREWRRGIEIVLSEVNGRVPVLAGISAPGTRLALHRLREVTALGVAAAVSNLPFYFPSDAEEMVTHYRTLAAATTIPIYAYDIALTKMKFTEALVAELAAMPGIVGMKDSSSDFTQFQKLVARFAGQDFLFFQGNETMLAHSLLMGAVGGVVGLGNVAPRLCVEVYDACRRRDYDAAYALQQKLVSLHAISRLSSSPLTAVKYATHLLGMGSDRATLPLKPLTAEQKRLVETKLRELELLA